MAGQENSKLIAVNRKARHDYFVMEAMEAGVELVGTEVKSIRTGAVNLKDSWVEIDGGELYVLGMHISPYEKGNIFNRDPVRKRKLLVHKREIKHLQEQQKLQGYTLIPLQLYFKRGKVKLELGVCKESRYGGAGSKTGHRPRHERAAPLRLSSNSLLYGDVKVSTGRGKRKQRVVLGGRT